MRQALKECLGDVKRSLKGKRMAAYGKKEEEGEGHESFGDSDRSEASVGSRKGSSGGTPGEEKALRKKVASAEDSAREEMEEAGEWQEEEVKQFMRSAAFQKCSVRGVLRPLFQARKRAKPQRKGKT
jgi:hypothetical protein